MNATPTAPARLGPTTLRVWLTIGAFAAEHGYPPGVRDVSRAMGWASPNAAWLHIVALRRAGLLETVPSWPPSRKGAARGLVSSYRLEFTQEARS